MAQNIDQSINDSSHRKMKEMQLLMGERYPSHISCHGIENLPYLFENQCLITLEGGKTPMAYCLVRRSPHDLINVLGPFSVILQQ